MAIKAGQIVIDISAGTAQLVLDLEKAKARLGDFGKSGASSIQQTSAALRVMEGNITNNIRAAERFLSSFKPIRELVAAAFPVVGAIAFGGVLVELGERVARFYTEFEEGPDKANKAFRDLNASLRLSDDALAVTSARLEDELAKLQGKPGNGLKEAIAEAREEADKLADSLDKDFDTLKKALDEATRFGLIKSLIGTNSQPDLAKFWGQTQQQLDLFSGSDGTSQEIREGVLKQALSAVQQQLAEAAAYTPHAVPGVRGTAAHAAFVTGFGGEHITSSADAMKDRFNHLLDMQAALNAMIQKMDFSKANAALKEQIKPLQAAQERLKEQQRVLRELDAIHDDMVTSMARESGYLAEQTEQYQRHLKLVNEVDEHGQYKLSAAQRVDETHRAFIDYVNKVSATWKKNLLEIEDDLPRLTDEVQRSIDEAWKGAHERGEYSQTEASIIAGVPAVGARPPWETNRKDFEDRQKMQLEIQEQRIRMLAGSGGEIEAASQIYQFKLREIELDRQKEETLARQNKELKSQAEIQDAINEANYRADTARMRALADLQAAQLQQWKRLEDAITGPVSSDLANMLTGKRPKGGWGQMWGKTFQGVGHGLLENAFKGIFDRIFNRAAQRGSSPTNPLFVSPVGGGFPGPVGSGSGSQRPWSENIPLPAAASRLAGIFGNIGQIIGIGTNLAGASARIGNGETIGSMGGGLGNGEAIGTMDTTIATSDLPYGGGRATGGDVDPGHIYTVGENGPEPFIPSVPGRVMPHGSDLGSTHIYNIDARGAALGVEARIAQAIEQAHSSAVVTATRAVAERQKRIPHKSKG